MPTLLVRVNGDAHRLPFAPSQPVRDVLDATEFRVRSACHGIGACGLCRIRVTSGDAGAPTVNERYHLSAAELQQGVRLACQVRPLQDIAVEILNRAPQSRWKSPPPQLVRDRAARPDGALRPTSVAVPHPLGLAVDIGTTHLSLSLSNLNDGNRLAERWGLNPQADFGADVIARLMAASASPETAATLGRCVVQAIRDGLWDIAAREGLELQHVVRITLVGNTAMLALLGGNGYQQLLQPAHWAERIDCSPPDTAPWLREWGVHPAAAVEVVAPLAGFIGSDLLAGLVATRLLDDQAPSLFVDVGTNSEMALWNGDALWVTASAGGPAFESSGISHGMPAETGAVFRVGYDMHRDVFSYEVLGDGVAKGICGSGLVDLVATLRRSGRLTAKGHLREADRPASHFAFDAGGGTLALTNRDVDALQRAKAAISAGMRVLCARAGVALQDLRHVQVAGAFGHYLDVPNAQAIGLLPSIAAERIRLVGNTALAGCNDLLLYTGAHARLAELSAKAMVINLAQSPEFDALFLEGLYLEPFAVPR